MSEDILVVRARLIYFKETNKKKVVAWFESLCSSGMSWLHGDLKVAPSGAIWPSMGSFLVTRNPFSTLGREVLLSSLGF